MAKSSDLKRHVYQRETARSCPFLNVYVSSKDENMGGRVSSRAATASNPKHIHISNDSILKTLSIFHIFHGNRQTKDTARRRLALPKTLRKPFRLFRIPSFSRGFTPGYDDPSPPAKGNGIDEKSRSMKQNELLP